MGQLFPLLSVHSNVKVLTMAAASYTLHAVLYYTLDIHTRVENKIFAILKEIPCVSDTPSPEPPRLLLPYFFNTLKKNSVFHLSFTQKRISIHLSPRRTIPCFPFICHTKEESPVSHSSFTMRKNLLFPIHLSPWRRISCFPFIFHSERVPSVSHGSFTLKKNPLFPIHLSL